MLFYFIPTYFSMFKLLQNQSLFFFLFVWNWCLIWHVSPLLMLRFVLLQVFLTHYGEVKGGLAHAKAVLQLHRVAAAVLLLPAADGQCAAAVCALHGNVRWTVQDLNKRSTQHRSSCGQVLTPPPWAQGSELGFGFEFILKICLYVPCCLCVHTCMCVCVHVWEDERVSLVFWTLARCMWWVELQRTCI